MSLIEICISDDFKVDYDKGRGMYRVSTFENNHFQDEYWFDAYEEKEVDYLFLVYGSIDESGDTDIWVEDIFDNVNQAVAFATYCNLTKTQDNVEYYASTQVWNVNKLDYIKKLKELKGNKTSIL